VKILNFGSMNIDYVYEVAHMMRPGETQSSLSRSVYAGGKGLNQSIAMARAGASVYHAGAVGQSDGAILLETLEKDQVNTQYIRVFENEASGHAIISVDREGQNSIILYGGTNQLITSEQISEVLSDFKAGDFLLLQNEISNNPIILEQAYALGMTIILNPSPSDSKLTELDLSKIDYLILNEIEGHDLSGTKDQQMILTRLSEMYPDLKIVLTVGEAGAVYKDRNREIRQDSYPVKTVDTTGAGDTFTGYFFASMYLGDSIERALDLAARAAAISVTRSGAQRSIPFKEEVLSYEFHKNQI